MVALCSALFVAGLVLTIGCVAFKVYMSSKADRLRAHGEAVMATVTSYYWAGSGRGNGASTLDLYYEYGGRAYQAQILCGNDDRCTDSGGTEIAVWVDPDNPKEFVAENGYTDDSVNFFNSWWRVIPGVALVLGGGGGLTIAVLAWRQRRSLLAGPTDQTE